MKKQLMVAALLAASTTALVPASADAALITGFTGPFNPGTFLLSITGNAPNGSITLNSTQLTLNGQDDPSIDPSTGAVSCMGAVTGFLGACQVIASHAVVGAADNVSFNWAYSTADVSPGYDLFGVLDDGVVTLLSDPGGPLSQSGNYAFTSNTSFAFFVNCTDCVGGAATAAVTNFQVAQVPEPSTVALAFAGAAVLVGTRLRRGADQERRG